MRIIKGFATLLFTLSVGLQTAQGASTGYQRYLNEKAIENLQSLEASHMVYNVYENFVVPRICRDSKSMIGGKKKAACKLLGHVQESDFVKVTADPTGVLYKAKDNYTKAAYYRFTGSKPEMVAAAPVGYRVSYVGCYRRAKNRVINGTECSLFFMIVEGINGKKPPIIAIKGSSHNEDWKNNMLAGAPILSEITTVFTTLFKELRTSIIGDSENMPGEITGLSAQLAGFFNRLSASTLRLTFTGHSLGGALAQELAREIFIATRKDIRDRASGPTIEVITWNGLSYTSMIGRLKKGLKSATDPILQAGWKEADALKLENFKAVFDGRFLSAVNFHTADDILTQLINTSIIGKFLRMGEHEGMIQAGADVLLASERFIAVSGLSGKVDGHGTATILKDALYSMGAQKNRDGTFSAVDLDTQLEQIDKRESSERAAARYKDTPQYFMQNGFNSDRYEKDGGMNIDLLIVAKEIQYNEKRADKYEAMEKALLRNGRYYGRILQPQNGVVDFTSQLTPSLY